ncbi:glycosyltransferase [Anaerolineales bacterium HSG24]|nr:glycosyltransferase [Anaerolineales bacterium HSG24]
MSTFFEYMSPLVSIIIRARDEAVALKRLLPILTEQKVDFDFEIWILDNESRDETTTIAQSFSTHLHTIPRNEFDYATVLNLSAKLAQGSFVVNLSAHCFPQDEFWLTNLIDPLRHNSKVIATYGRQWFNPQTSPYTAEGNDYFFPPTRQQVQIVAFSNSNAAIRKSAILRHPFNPYIKIFEDHLFYLELSPHSLFEYVPESLVHHEHNDFGLRYNLKRWSLEGWAFYFILKQRGFISPFKTDRFFQLRELMGYILLTGKLCRSKRCKAGLAALPLHLLREIMWAYGWLQGWSAHSQIAKQDQEFLRQIRTS